MVPDACAGWKMPKRVPGVLTQRSISLSESAHRALAGTADVFEIKGLDDADISSSGAGKRPRTRLRKHAEELTELKMKLVVGAILGVLVHVAAAPISSSH
jgi:hypothetical protein